jgi:hypothetical protein
MARFDELSFGHMPFHHPIIDRPRETGSHSLFIQRDPMSKSLEFCSATLLDLFQPGI